MSPRYRGGTNLPGAEGGPEMPAGATEPPAMVCAAVEDDDFYCTLDSDHDGRHEAWTCSCAGGGRCLNPAGFVASWPHGERR